MSEGVVVANPGPVSWMIESARAFAEKGTLAHYLAPVVVSERDIERLRRWPLPSGAASLIESNLRRRMVPPEVGRRVGRVGTALDVANVLLLRTRLPTRATRALFRSRMLAFDRGVSRRLTSGVSAVVGYQGSSVTTFRRARSLGVGTVLDYPIAHFATTEAVLAEEARRMPELAYTIQPYPPWLLRRYTEEIAAADRIIVLSTYQRQTFADAGVDPARTFIAPLCVDLEVFTPPAAPPEGPFRVAFCGQITQRKGISYLIEGFHAAAIPGAELLLIGPPLGPARPWAGRPGVRHVPAMPRSALPEVLRRCHAIALPSLIEGFGAAALEGMACGLPAIVSPNTFADDVIEDGIDGWIVPIRDPDAIAERLRRLHDDPDLRARMSAAARAKASQYPWARYREALRAGVAPLLSDAPP
jgi:glycosyltransferase involved in cell wall biosynthesis